MGAKPSRAVEHAEATSQQFQEGVQQMKEKAKETYGRVTGRGEYGTEKYKKYQLPMKAPELKEEDYSFFTENTGKSKDEIKRIFDKYNLLQSDAKLQRSNFINLYRELNPDIGEQVNEIADQSYHAFDPDATNSLSFNEFLVTYALTSKGDMRRKLDYSFDLYDTDHSGYLEKDEVKNVLNGICDLLGAEKKQKNSEEIIAKTVREIHFDEKDRVRREDFINGLMKNQDVRELMQPYSTTSERGSTSQQQQSQSLTSTQSSTESQQYQKEPSSSSPVV